MSTATACPQLPHSAAGKQVSAVLSGEHRLPDALVGVSAGGTRGLIVKVTLPATAASALPTVTQALASYLFEARVVIA